jgi:hypothetical protein
MTAPHELYNRLSGEIVTTIVRPMILEGMTTTEALVLLESVIAGVCLAIVKLGGDEPVIDKLAEGVKLRMAEIRLKNLEPWGRS